MGFGLLYFINIAGEQIEQCIYKYIFSTTRGSSKSFRNFFFRFNRVKKSVETFWKNPCIWPVELYARSFCVNMGKIKCYWPIFFPGWMLFFIQDRINQEKKHIVATGWSWWYKRNTCSLWLSAPSSGHDTVFPWFSHEEYCSTQRENSLIAFSWKKYVCATYSSQSHSFLCIYQDLKLDAMNNTDPMMMR